MGLDFENLYGRNTIGNTAAQLDIDRGPLTMLVDATLLTEDEIQNEADERTTLALVIGEGESER
jgi:hypothetical protein